MKAVVALAALAFTVALMASPAVAAFNYGADISVLASVNQLRCMAKATPPVTHVIVRGYRSTGSSDPNVVQTLKNAVAAGYSPSNLGVYIFPRPLNSAGSIQDGGIQVKNMMDNLLNNGAGDLFTTIWLDIEGGDLYWSRITGNNIKFLEQMVAQALKYRPKYALGIYTSKSQWSPIVGSYVGPSNKAWTASDFPLWYAGYNGKTDFSDFSPFAGWTVPTLHQYAGDKVVCKVGADLNVMNAGTLADQSKLSKINGGGGPPELPIPNSAACAAQRGACSNTAKKPCVGTVKKGLCSGGASIVCCVSAPVLRSSPGSSQKLAASTDASVTAEAVDTGVVTWHNDRAGRRSARKMKMGGLMRIHRAHHRQEQQKKKNKKKRVKATPARVRNE